MKESQKFLEVLANEPVSTPDKNGKSYNQLTVRPIASTILNPATGEFIPVIDMMAKQTRFNQWEDSYINEGQPDLAYNAPIGSAIPGAIVTRTVQTPYTFTASDGEEVATTTYTTVVFGNTSDEATFENLVRAAFRRAEHPVVGDEQIDLVEDEVESIPEVVEA